MPSASYYTHPNSLRIFDTNLWPPLLREYLQADGDFLRQTVKPGSIALDIGCGVGRHTSVLSSICKEVIAIDSSPIILEECGRRTAQLKNVKLHLAKAEHLPFPAESFDYVVCMFNTLGIMPQDIQHKALREMRRVCRKNGKIIISVYADEAEETQKQLFINVGLTITEEDKHHVYTDAGLVSERFTFSRLKQLFASAQLDMDIERLTRIAYICTSR